MPQVAECMHNGYLYTFSSFPVQFWSARGNCELSKGSLPRHLDQDDYINLQKCTGNNGEYWIGLFENDACENNAIGSYTWVIKLFL